MKYNIIYGFIIISFFSCGKEFLMEKPDTKLVVPTTLEDGQAILDYNEVMNLSSPLFSEVSADDFYLSFNEWSKSNSDEERNAYVWAKDFYGGIGENRDWNNGYMKVFYANNVLELLENLKSKEQEDKLSPLRGAALFYRSHAFFELAQLFCAPYNKNEINNALGIPLKLKSDINISVKRATVEQTYDQIVKDLVEAAQALPDRSLFKTQPVKAAAYALLSRVYLSMQDYENALIESEKLLSLNEFKLMDFNQINANEGYPIKPFNSEVIFHSCMASGYLLWPTDLKVDTNLHKLYSENDLRKTVFFLDGNNGFKGSYDGSYMFFNGLAIDEIYLTKAECLARVGREDEALKTLNDFLKYRLSSENYQELKIASIQISELLEIILNERRKELLFRGIRWMDLRRLNLETETSSVIKRYLNGKEYLLRPNSINYVLPIPPMEISMTSITQNERE